ncbi:hypothetical protein SCREM1_125 [Synechococcus phage S-CREM1]|nr:hypothetical protein SCREM1_125 [Synechococcus phage S-CREM1]
MSLINIVQQYEDRVAESDKQKLSTLGFVDKFPLGLLPLEEAIKQYNPQPGDTFPALVMVSELYSDPKYNRSDKIHYKNCSTNLSKLGGFSYKAAGFLSAFFRPNKKVVLTKGNHRGTKAYASCRNPKAYVPVEITYHNTEVYDEIVKIESEDHHFDCNFRTTQSQEDRFKSAYYAQDAAAISLYNFLDQFGIGVADTNPSAVFSVSSHSYIEKARSLNAKLCEVYLKAFTKNNCEHIVGGNATFAGTFFLNAFANSIQYIDINNDVDSFDMFMKYIYHDREDLSHGFLSNVDQAKLTEGNGKFKGAEVNVARLISLYNEFCMKVLRAKIPTSNKHAIGYSSNEYLNFIKNSDEIVRTRVDEISTSKI